MGTTTRGLIDTGEIAAKVSVDDVIGALSRVAPHTPDEMEALRTQIDVEVGALSTVILATEAAQLAAGAAISQYAYDHDGVEYSQGCDEDWHAYRMERAAIPGVRRLADEIGAEWARR